MIMNKLKVGDTGSFKELSDIENSDNLIVTYNPPIEAMLERAEQLKGKPLNESESERIKNNSPAIALPKGVYEATYENK